MKPLFIEILLSEIPTSVGLYLLPEGTQESMKNQLECGKKSWSMRKKRK
jgi:hypothetical protein